MASISGTSQRSEPRSGGKVLRQRRLRPTPYERPRVLNSTQQNPNWISRRIMSPTRTILSGAGRIISSVFGSEISSSSSSSSDDDSSSDDSDEDSDGKNVFSPGVNTAEHREPQYFAGKNETKRLIEQLVMQESFSSEECDKLTSMIKSRVVDSPIPEGMGVGRLNGTPSRTGGNDFDLYSTAVMEARKWLEEKKSGSNSKSELHHGTSSLSPLKLAHGAEVDAGSPVDVAKSYMRTRPPWASPSANNIEFRSPSPIGMPLFKEGTPISIGGNSLSSSKHKRDFSAIGSWNIQDEIRKVRSKATEEMLRTISSSNIDWSSFAQEHKNGPPSLVTNNLEPAEEDNPHISKKSLDAPADLTARSVSQVTQDTLHSDTLPSSATLVCTQIQGEGGIQSIEGKRDSQVEDKSCSTLKGAAGAGGAESTANGFPSSASSMSAEPDEEQNHGPIDDEEDKAVVSGHDDETRMSLENCKLLSEADVEVPVVGESVVATGPKNSPNVQNTQDSQQPENTTQPKRGLASKTDTGKKQGKRVSRYTRKSRG